MKKCIRFLLSFLCILFISIEVNAGIRPEGTVGFYGRNGGYYPCFYDAEFDYLIGRDAIKSDEHFLTELNSIISGVGSPERIGYEGKYKSLDGLDEVNFYCYIFSSGGSAKKINYYVENVLVYEAVKENGTIVASKNEPVDLNYYAGTRNKLFCIEKSNNHFSANCDFSLSEMAENKFDWVVLEMLYGYRVYENDKYENKDLFFIVDSCNPLDEADIISSLVVTDPTCGNIPTSNIKIIDTEYSVTNNYVKPGAYDMTIKAWDNYGNITYQKCKIISADVTAPVVISPDTIKAKANELLTNDEIISKFTAYDEYSSVNIAIDKNDYENNYNKVGEFNVSIIVTDEAGNSTKSSTIVEVEDKTKPTITYEEKCVSIHESLSEDDIKAFITVFDNVDGLITNFEIVDVDGYFEEPRKPGEYQFEVYVSDSHGNPNSDMISLYVVDDDTPIIEAPKYTVLLNKGENVTREQILNILKATGQITSMENTILNSLYFSTLNPEGEYDLEVISDGEVLHDVIRFVEPNNKPSQVDDDFYAIPVRQEQNNTTYYIVLGVTIGVIIILATLGVIIYKKKH